MSGKLITEDQQKRLAATAVDIMRQAIVELKLVPNEVRALIDAISAVAEALEMKRECVRGECGHSPEAHDPTKIDLPEIAFRAIQMSLVHTCTIVQPQAGGLPS